MAASEQNSSQDAHRGEKYGTTCEKPDALHSPYIGARLGQP